MNSGAVSPSSTAPKKPRFALFIATACGLGYIPFAPGTFGSLLGLALAASAVWLVRAFTLSFYYPLGPTLTSAALRSDVNPLIFGLPLILAIATAALGTWSAHRAAAFWGQKDPQRVVIDEVSGQHLSLLLGCAAPVWWRVIPGEWGHGPLGLIAWDEVPNWKYLLLGFILFRVFDIWKPFPVRQAEKLPGGWGIMADDWVAALYAALGLWIARAAGL